MRVRWLCGLALGCSVLAYADTLYLCRAYSGGEFWSAQHCAGQRAGIVRIAEVPPGLTHTEQVKLAQQAKTAADKLAQPPRYTRSKAVANTDAQCQRLRDQINRLDAQSRQPQTGPQQDRITDQKRSARHKQFELKCR